MPTFLPDIRPSAFPEHQDLPHRWLIHPSAQEPPRSSLFEVRTSEQSKHQDLPAGRTVIPPQPGAMEKKNSPRSGLAVAKRCQRPLRSLQLPAKAPRQPRRADSLAAEVAADLARPRVPGNPGGVRGPPRGPAPHLRVVPRWCCTAAARAGAGRGGEDQLAPR